MHTRNPCENEGGSVVGGDKRENSRVGLDIEEEIKATF